MKNYSLKLLKHIVGIDLYRHSGNNKINSFIKHFYNTPGFKVIFYIRLCQYLRKNLYLKYTLYLPIKFLYTRATIRYGISIPITCEIGEGFYIGHYGNIVIHYKVKIGKNCNISHGVTIGTSGRGEKKGVPTIGDYVYMGPGSKIFGKIYIGNNSAIGANCVVTKDVPEKATVAGVPGKVISYKGSNGYIIRIKNK